MKMHKMMVLAKAMPGQVEALAKWYDEKHICDLLAVPGLVTAERHTIMPVKRPEGTPEWDFMLIYELEGENPMIALKNLGDANVALSDLMESSQTLSLVCLSQGVRKEN
jgi:hypothetical protein